MEISANELSDSSKNQKKFKDITEQVPKHVNELYDAGSTIGAFILFPNKRIDGKYTINQARGINTLINDRFDLTLECIRRYYKAEKSPLYETFLRYNRFFELFETFEGYVNFFLLNDLLDNHGKIKFYLPFDEFKTRPQFNDVSCDLVSREEVYD